MNRSSARQRGSEREDSLSQAVELARRSRDPGCGSLSDAELESLLYSASASLGEYPETKHISDALGVVDTAVQRRLGTWRAATSEIHDLDGTIQQVRQQAELELGRQAPNNHHSDAEADGEDATRSLLRLLVRLRTEHPSEVRLSADFYEQIEAADDTGCLWFAPTEQQLTAAELLLRGVIVEMDAGEGKTLASAMAAAVFAASGRNVHVLTANDYLAARDCDLLAPVLESLGLTVGLAIDGMDRQERKYQYAAQVVFTTAREVGFDYLRDGVAASIDHRVNPVFDVAIVDEVDHLLIDQARTPLIISGDRVPEGELGIDHEALVTDLMERQTDHVEELYAALSTGADLSRRLATILLAGGLTSRLVSELDQHGISTRRVFSDMSRLNDEDEGSPLEKELIFAIDPGRSTLRLTELGWDEVFTKVDSPIAAFGVLQALRARILHDAGTDYVLDQSGITLVDRLDGRPMVSHRYMHGLHEALESKEGIDRLGRTDSKARTSIRALMSNYETISGLTGTAMDAENTFTSEYGVSTVRVPPEVASKRVDLDTEVFFDKDEHLAWVVDQIDFWHNIGRPVLVTTGSVQESSALSSALAEQSISHQLLNAENAELESEVVGLGGEPGAVTVSTGMAGRGTDFVVEDYVDQAILARAVSGAKLTLKRDQSPVFECSSRSEAEALLQAFNELDDWEAEARVSRSVSEVVARPLQVDCLGEERMPFGLGLLVLITSLPESVRVERQVRGRTARQGAFGTTKVAVYINDATLAFSSRQGDLARLSRTPNGTVGGPEVNRILGQVQIDAERQRDLISRAMAEYEAVVESESRAHYTERVHMMSSVQTPALVERVISDWVARRTRELDNHRGEYETRFAIVSDSLWHNYQIDIEMSANWTPLHARRELELELQRRFSVHRDRLGSKRFSLAVAECRLNAADDLWPARLAHMNDMVTTLAIGASSRHAAITELAEDVASSRPEFWAQVEDQALRILLNSANVAGRVRMGDNHIEQLPEELEALLR